MPKKRKKPRCYAYVRVSTGNQTVDSQRLQIFDYGKKKGLKIHDFISAEMSAQKSEKDRKIDELRDKLQAGDTLIVAELSRLGRSIGQIVRLIEDLKDQGIRLVCLKEGIDTADDSIQTDIMIGTFSMMAQVEHRLIRERVKNGLQAAKAKGRTLGRRKGILQRSKLDEHKDRIKELLGLGVPPARIARQYGVSRNTIYHFMKTRGLRA